MPSESHLVHDILITFGAHPDILLWRSNTGAARAGDRLVRFGARGQADITGVIRVRSQALGAALFIECKSATGKQSPDQVLFQRNVTSMGAIYILARSVQDVWDALPWLARGDT